MVETAWLLLEILTGGLDPGEFAAPLPSCLLDGSGGAEPTDVRAAGLHAYSRRLLVL